MNERKRAGGKKNLNRRKIISAAKELFDQRGLENVTFGDIAEAVDMSRSTIFNYFATKEELIEAMLRREVEQLAEHAEREEESGKEFILSLLDCLTDNMCQHPQIMFKLIHGDPAKGGQANILEHVHMLIQSHLPTDDPEEQRLMLIAIIGSYHGLLSEHWFKDKAHKAEAIKVDYRKMINSIFAKHE